MVGLEKGNTDRRLENFEGIVSPSCFELVARTHARLLESFRNQIFFSISCSRKDVYEVECW